MDTFIPSTGTIFTMVRLDSPVEECETLEDCNRAALLRYDTQNHRLDFHSLVPFPSSCNKFAVKQHPGDGKFYSLSNPVTLVPVKNYGTGSCGQRNTVVLTQSEDLLHWKTCDVVLYDDTGLARDDSLRYTGLQYIDFIFEGDDIIAAVRAGYRGATTYHDANRLLLANVSGFAARCEA